MIVTISAPRFAALALFAGVDETRYYLQQVHFSRLPAEHMKKGRMAWFSGSPGAYVASATDGHTALRVRCWILNKEENFAASPETFGIKPDKTLTSACKTRAAHSVSFDAPDLTKEAAQVVWQVRNSEGKLLKQGFCETASGTFPGISRIFPYALERGAQGAFVQPCYMERAAKAAALMEVSGVRIDGSGSANDPLFIIFGADPDACGLIMPFDICREPRKLMSAYTALKENWRKPCANMPPAFKPIRTAKEARSVTAAYVPEWARV